MNKIIIFYNMKQILIKSLLFHFAKRVIYMLLLITCFSKKFIWESQPLIYVTNVQTYPNSGTPGFSYYDNFTRIRIKRFTIWK